MFMDFTEFCVYILFIGITWQLAAYFISDSSQIQQRRFHEAVFIVHNYIFKNTSYGHPPIAYSLNYRNKTFDIGIIEEEVDRYTKYRIFINGDEASCFHVLRGVPCDKYYFEPKNRRHADEVRAIIYAAVKQLRKQAKAKNTDSYTEYSYFK